MRTIAVNTASLLAVLFLTLLNPLHAASPQLGIERANPHGLPRLLLNGTAGQTYHLEAAKLYVPQWAPWLFAVRNQPLAWEDTGGDDPALFFRLKGALGRARRGSVQLPLLARRASRDLYHTHLAGSLLWLRAPT
jgi:hypothetical protein